MSRLFERFEAEVERHALACQTGDQRPRFYQAARDLGFMAGTSEQIAKSLNRRYNDGHLPRTQHNEPD